PHMRAGVTKSVTSPPERKPPVAPPVYRPQPEPKVLQRKNSLASKPDTAHSRLVLSLQRPAVAPQPVSQSRKALAAAAHQDRGRVLQPKASTAPPRTPPKPPPVYRPQPAPRVAQSKAWPAIRRVTPQSALTQRIVQRMAVAFSNLRKVSSVPFADGGGQGLVRGSKIPHHSQALTIGGTAMTYNVDDWTNKKDDARMSGSVSQQEVGKDFYKLFDRSNRKKLRKLIKAWNCNSTILDPILANFIFEGEQTAKWYDDPTANDADTVALTVRDSLSGSKALVAHLIAARAAIHYRENTMTLLNVNTVSITYGLPSTTENDVNLDWDALKHDLRA